MDELLLSELYVSYFDRAPDADGLAYWKDELSSGRMSLDGIAENWANEQPEFQEKYEGLSEDEFINQVYQNVLGREPDDAGKEYWAAELANGKIPASHFIQAVSNGAKASTGNPDDAALVNNKAEVGMKVAQSGINDVEFAKKAVKAVSKDPNTVEIVNKIVDMGKGDSETLSKAAGTLEAVKTLLDANASSDNAVSVIENVKTMVEAIAQKVESGEVEDLGATLEAIGSTVTAASVDPDVVSDPTAKATDIEEDPEAATEAVADLVEQAEAAATGDDSDETPTDETPTTSTPSSGGATPADTTAPIISSIAMTGGTKTIVLTMSESVTGAPDATDFTVNDGVANTVTGVSVSGTSVTLTLTNYVENASTVTVAYTQNADASKQLKDAAGNATASTTAPESVTLTDDTVAPKVISFEAEDSIAGHTSGSYKSGVDITITATMDKAVESGSQIDVTLDTTDVVTLTASSAGTTLTGTYTVGAGDTSSDLTVTSFTNGTTDTTSVAGSVAMSDTTLPAGQNIADNAQIIIDTTAPTSTITSATFDENTAILTLSGTKFDEATGIGNDLKDFIDWSKLSWDIDGDDGGTANVSFSASDITSAIVTNATTLTITLASTKSTELIGTTNYQGATPDTLDVTAGFIRDQAMNAATTDSASDATITITDDTTRPTTGVNDDISISTDTGTSDTDLITKIASQTISATLTQELEAGDIVYGTSNNSTWVNITDKVSGTDIVWDGATLTNGDSAIIIYVGDAAGNQNVTNVANENYTLDTTAPTATLTYSTDGGSSWGTTANVNDADTLKIKAVISEPIMSGTATIAIDNSILSSTAMTMSAYNTYIYTLDVPSGDIANATVTVAVTDSAGNSLTGAPTNPSFTIDNTTPSTTVVIGDNVEGDNVVNDTEKTDVLVQGTNAEANATIDVTFSDSAATPNTVTKQVIADGSGNWTLTGGNEADLSTLDDGDITISVVQSDSAGNQASAVTKTIKLDSTVPTNKSNLDIYGLDLNGSNANDYQQGDTLTIRFSESVDQSTVTIGNLSLNNGHTFGTGAAISPFEVDANGFADTYTITLGATPTVAAADDITASASIVDEAGNATDAVFTVAPSSSVITISGGDVAATGSDGVADIFLVVGDVAPSQYSGADANYNDLTTINGHSTDVSAGDSIDGGTGYDILHVYGTVDLSNTNISGIEEIIVHSDVTFTAGQLASATKVNGDGGSTVRVASGDEDLSGKIGSGISQFDLQSGASAGLTQADIDNIKTISSKGTLSKQDGGNFDFTGKITYGSQDFNALAGGVSQAPNLKETITAMSNMVTNINTSFQSAGLSTIDTTGLDVTSMSLIVGDLSSSEVLAGDNGIDMIVAGSGGDTITTSGGGSDLNFVMAGAGNDDVTGGAGTDFISGDLDITTLNWTDFANAMTQLSSGDQATQLAGLDALGDFFNGGAAGDDTIDGGAGIDFIMAGAGADSITGGTGFDVIQSGDDADTIIIHDVTLGDASDMDHIDGLGMFEYADIPADGFVDSNSDGTDDTGLDYSTVTVEDMFDFKTNNSDLFAGQAETLLKNDITTVLSSVTNEGILVFTDSQLGDVAGLTTILHNSADALDTSAAFNKVIAWSIHPTNAPGMMYLGILSNASTTDNDISITPVGILDFEDSTEMGVFLTNVSASNFDLIA
jgi:hypothetical protein